MKNLLTVELCARINYGLVSMTRSRNRGVRKVGKITNFIAIQFSFSVCQVLRYLRSIKIPIKLFVSIFFTPTLHFFT